MSLLKKFINQTFFVILLFLIFSISDIAIAKVFDRIVAKVNSEIITLSSVNERVELLKQKFRGDYQGSEEEILDKAGQDFVVSETKLAHTIHKT